jgi:hypothetical protein
MRATRVLSFVAEYIVIIPTRKYDSVLMLPGLLGFVVGPVVDGNLTNFHIETVYTGVLAELLATRRGASIQLRRLRRVLLMGCRV